jgi:CheY-like chemotaxis protein
MRALAVSEAAIRSDRCASIGEARARFGHAARTARMTDSGPAKTILIADDEPSLRLLVHATIASGQHRVLEAADGDEAWTLLKEQRPTVAILDVQMPGRTGLELTRLIREDATLRGIQVILLTSKAQAADVQAGLDAGADLYLTKPFSPLELLTSVEQALATIADRSRQSDTRFAS